MLLDHRDRRTHRAGRWRLCWPRALLRAPLIRQMDFAERAARNEEIFRSINERIEAGAELHWIRLPEQYHCECDRTGCFESRYERGRGD